MVKWRATWWLALGFVLPLVAAVYVQQVGSIRGVVTDKEFGSPLPGVDVTLAETGARVTSTEDGHYVFTQVPAGTYTVVFSKDGYSRQVKSGVVVSSGQLTDVDMALPGEITEMEEFVVQDIQVGGEANLLKLRMDSPALIDSISSDLMRQAGASDAAAALRLVTGATVQEGKFAVIRGLPDRYVNSQMNGVRLPTADEDKRAVQLDQFPSAVINSVQVSKTFTPDQQGDASGGAVNVVLKGIPDAATLQIQGQLGFNSQVAGSDFLTYHGGGVNQWGIDNGGRDIQFDHLGGNWDGAVGTSRGSPPTDYKWSIAGGGKHEFDNGIKVGGFASVFYERDSSFYDNGVNDSLWVVTPGGPMVPQTIQGDPQQGSDFKTKLFDVTQGQQSVQWGALGTAGIETEHNKINFTYLYTRIAEDTATLAEDTRGKAFFFPGYDPNNPLDPGNAPGGRDAAPYIRTETLEYTERVTETFQLNGHHVLPFGEWSMGNFLKFEPIEFDWIAAHSVASLDQPDKRQFGELWLAEGFDPGIPGVIPPSTLPAVHLPFKPAANFTLGNLQRIWKNIDEDADDVSLNLKMPFKQWTDNDGYFKFGVFNDNLHRNFNQDTFSNFNDNSSFPGEFNDPWSQHFPSQDHPITDGPPFVDVDYKGHQQISAWYGMVDLPLCSFLDVIGGARLESTDLSIVNFPEANATWFPPGTSAPVQLNPGDADVHFSQDDVLPAIEFVLKPFKQVTMRGSYSQTVARQTFKELTPVIQQEFLGGPIFIGNPELQMSALKNYDLRLDYTPYDGSLVSVSWFYKDVTDPIEYVQRLAAFEFTTPVNYPKGWLDGFEFEVRQDLGHFWPRLGGLALGANATFMDSQVTLPPDERAGFNEPGIEAPMSHRPMTGTPEHLFNVYMTYNIEPTGTQFGVFYTVTGDTLIAGAAQANGRFVPSIFATEYDTLNLTISQKLWKHFTLQFEAKNLTNPEIQTVYRSKYIKGDVLNTSFTNGIDFSVSLRAEFTF